MKAVFKKLLKKIAFPLIFFLGFFGEINAEVGDQPITNYVVALDGSGDYLSIQDAIDAAYSKGGNATVWIKNGSYVENLILYSGINLVGASGLGDLGDVEITGTHVPPLSGHIILRNIRWNGSNYIFYSLDSGTCHIVIMDALLNVKNGYTCFLPNWNGAGGGALEFQDINPGLPNQSQDGMIYNPSGGAQVFLYNAGIGIGTSNTMYVSGQMIMLAASISCPVQFNSGAVLECDSSLITEGMIFTGNSTAEISNSRITNDSGAVIVMDSSGGINLNACVIDGYNNPTITGNGKGQLKISGCTFPKETHISPSVSSGIVGSIKAGCLEISPNQVKVFSGVGPPTSSAPQGSLYLRADGSSSNTRIYINIDGGYAWTSVITEK